MNNVYNIIRGKNGEAAFKQNQKRLFYEKNKFYGFKEITEERKKEIEEQAEFWVLQNKELDNQERLYNLYCFLNVTTEQGNVYKLKAHDEKFLFLIHAFDPSLKLLQIYFEESNKAEIKKRFQEEFHTFYDARLLQLEQYYNKRFPTIVDEFDRKI